MQFQSKRGFRGKRFLIRAYILNKQQRSISKIVLLLNEEDSLQSFYQINKNLTRKAANSNRNHTITEEMLSSKLNSYDLNSYISVEPISRKLLDSIKMIF